MLEAFKFRGKTLEKNCYSHYITLWGPQDRAFLRANSISSILRDTAEFNPDIPLSFSYSFLFPRFVSLFYISVCIHSTPLNERVKERERKKERKKEGKCQLGFDEHLTFARLRYIRRRSPCCIEDGSLLPKFRQFSTFYYFLYNMLRILHF